MVFKFLKENWKKILLWLVLFVTITISASTLGVKINYKSECAPETLADCTHFNKLNQFLWLPAPLFTADKSYFYTCTIYGCEPVREGLILTSAAYWALLSFLITFMVFWIIEKIKPKKATDPGQT